MMCAADKTLLSWTLISLISHGREGKSRAELTALSSEFFLQYRFAVEIFPSLLVSAMPTLC